MRNKLIRVTVVLIMLGLTATVTHYCSKQPSTNERDTITIQVQKLIHTNDTIYQEIVKEAEKIKVIQKKYEKDVDYISNAELDAQCSFFASYLSEAD